MQRLHFRQALLPDGWAEDVAIAVGGGLIASLDVGAAADPAAERHAIGVPGMANLHSHAFQRGMAGLAEIRGPGDDDFWSWREVMYRFALRMTPDELEAVAAMLYAEMLEAGFTRVGEFHYLHHDPDGQPYADPAEMGTRIAAAALQSGIGLTLLPVLYRHGSFGGVPAHDGQRRFISTLDAYERLVEASGRAIGPVEGAVLGLAPHSLRAVAPDELAAVGELLPDRPLHLHVAEQTKEVEDCLAWSGARPVRWLLDHAAVGPRWCLIHATHMDAGEVAGVAQSGAVAGLCPLTEGNLGDGIFPGHSFCQQNGRFGVGSDSNVQIGVAAELRQLQYAQRLGARSRNLMTPPGCSTGETMFQAARAGGAQALGQAQAGIVPGAPADLVSLRAGHAALAGHAPSTWLDAWIFNAGNALVDRVWARGRLQVEDGQHVSRAAIEPAFRRAMERLAA